jgi:hypothetical protein
MAKDVKTIFPNHLGGLQGQQNANPQALLHELLIKV